jgi:hypothetical protein
MCKLCARNALVFPACEAFQKRLDDPNHYFLFYKYFLRSAVGDEEWKRNSSSNKSIELSSRLATPLDEAFALVMLQNNYFSWLLEVKEEYGDSLVTDYDSSHRASNGTPLLSLIQYTHLKVCAIDLKDGEEENGYVWTTINEEEHDQATSDAMEVIMRTRGAVQHSKNYTDFVESIKEIKEKEDDFNDDDKKRQIKRRKIMKGLRQYTGAKQENETKKRGWSIRGYQQLMEIKEAIIEDADKYKRFNIAVRKVINLSKESEEKENDELNGAENIAPVTGLYDDIPCVMPV